MLDTEGQVLDRIKYQRTGRPFSPDPERTVGGQLLLTIMPKARARYTVSAVQQGPIGRKALSFIFVDIRVCGTTITR